MRGRAALRSARAEGRKGKDSDGEVKGLNNKMRVSGYDGSEKKCNV